MRTRSVQRAIAALLGVAIAFQESGCALMLHNAERVQIRCGTWGAEVFLDGHPVGPGERVLEVGRDYVVSASAPGFLPMTQTIKGRSDLAVKFIVFDLLWCLMFGVGLVFLGVDIFVANNNLWELNPRELDLVLV